MFNLLLNTFFPPFCAGCNRPFTVMCDRCYEKLDFLFTKIALNLKPNYLDQLQAAVHYKGPIISLIKEMKYLSVKANAHWCGVMLYKNVNFPQADMVTSIPLHPRRQRQRGFNQATEIALSFSQLSQIPYQSLLIRSVNNPHQASFHLKSTRLHSLDKTFQLNKLIDLQTIKNKAIIIVDDVITTGTTLNEAAKILKANGAKRVYGLAVAHD